MIVPKRFVENAASVFSVDYSPLILETAGTSETSLSMDKVTLR
jgi:hypothetical protein